MAKHLQAQTNLKKLAILPISLVILTVLFFQASIGLRSVCPPSNRFPSFLKNLCPSFPSPPAIYPFLDYPMYSTPKYEGDSFDRYWVFGISENSNQVRILPKDIGGNFWLFQKNFVSAIQKNDKEKISQYVELYQSSNPNNLVKVRLENHPLVLSSEGLYPGKTQVIETVKLKTLQEKK